MCDIVISTMTKSQRKLLFWTAVLVFLVMSPLAVLYAVGYSFDFESHMFVKTSSLRFVANTNAEVFVNGKSWGGLSFFSKSLSKSRLLPGEYRIELRKPDFITWSKTIHLDPSQFTDFPRIVLTPQNLKADPIATISFDPQAIALESGSLMAVSRTINKAQKNQVLIPRVSLIDPGNASVSYVPTEQATSILRGVEFDRILPNYLDQAGHIIGDQLHIREFYGDGRVAWFNEKAVFITWPVATAFQPFIKAFTTSSPILFDEPIREVAWHNDGEHLYVLSGTSLYFVDIDFRGTIQKNLIQRNVQGKFAYSTEYKAIYWFNNNKLFKLNADF